MKHDLDLFTEELSKAMSLEKASTPRKLYSKWRQWLQSMRSPRVGQQYGRSPTVGQSGRHARTSQQYVKRLIYRKAEDLMAFQSLKKNQMMASLYESGTMKMDFGAAVPETVKKAALRWARKKGLKVIEASLSKSDNSPMTYVLGITEDLVPYGECIKRFKRDF